MRFELKWNQNSRDSSSSGDSYLGGIYCGGERLEIGLIMIKAVQRLLIGGVIVTVLLAALHRSISDLGMIN